MAIQIKEIESKEIWEAFLKRQPNPTFLQSWDWSCFQEKFRNKVYRLGVFENDNLVGICMCYVIKTRFRTHIYTSGGPIIDWHSKNEAFPMLLGYLKLLAIKNNAKFIRIDPQILDSKENHELLQKYNLVMANTNTQAEKKWVLDLSPDLETILNNMRKNTRYSIRKAEKQGIKTTFTTKAEDFLIFWNLFTKTFNKQHFTPHPKSYYQNQFEAFRSEESYRLYYSKVDETILCSALFIFYGDSACYLHAANDSENREFMGAYDLIWQVIKDAKAAGIKYLDFWGIAPNDDPKHPWAGFTFFKKGFGGNEVDIIRAYDYPVTWDYPLIRLIEGSMKHWGNLYYKIFKK
jgi:lipid II:glycine glycyltransferase (peptidoglycan interpeptide bridge formation enzyme)